MDVDALAFGAHADDVELSCGGTLIKLGALGYKTGVVVLSRGEWATRGNAEIRAQEFDAAAATLGLAEHRMLDIPDARIEVTWENKLKIINEIRAFKPKIVFAPYWVTRHPDHEKTSHLVRESAYLAGLKKLETGLAPFRPRIVVYYQERFEFAPSFIVDISECHERKMRSIMAYKSQFLDPPDAGSSAESTFISRPGFLEGIAARDKHYGARIQAAYGEPFFVREAMKLHDPVAFFDAAGCERAIP